MKQNGTEPPPTHVMVAVPTMGSVHPRLAALLLEWARSYHREYLSFFMTQRVYPHDRARNRIVKHFLAQPQATHLLMIDSDMIPPLDAVERLLSHRKTFVTGMTPVPQIDTATGGNRVVDFVFAPHSAEDPRLVAVPRNSGLREIHRCAAGCLMLHRSLFERISKPWFRFVLNEDGTEITASEDVDFCDRLRTAGVTLFADTSVLCQHEKPMLL